MTAEGQIASDCIGELEEFRFVELSDGHFKRKCQGDGQNFRTGNDSDLSAL